MMKVFVKLLIISKEVEGDLKAERLLDMVQNGILSDAKRAKTLLQQQQQQHDYDYDSKDEDDEDDDDIAVLISIQKQVTRFLQTKDKYTALTSMLMKSQAFYNTYNNHNNKFTTTNITANHHHQQQQQIRRRCVVELPRTKYKKPYIPVVLVDSNKRNSIINKEEDIYPISVSHQYPFVGLARLLIQLDTTSTMDHDHTTQNVASNSNHHQHVIGMDIVAFDPPNPKLYSSVDEFINVFRSSSFTEWEWSLITDNHENNNNYYHQLHEFYIRWSMKEAYTKALGLGMGIDFTTFEMRLLLDDDVGDDGQSKSLWRRIQLATIQQSQNTQKKDAVKGCYISGSICHLESGKVEYWDFFFMPLFPHDCQDIDSTVQNQNDDIARGCMCICVGPYDTTIQPTNSTTDHRFQVDIEWTNLQSLIDWHHPS